jgi:DHA3 family tetracycline resistance protein-like MFS transporter
MPLAMTERLGFARALRSQRFALLWSGQTVSALGDGAFFTALAWQVLKLTGSGTAMGLALVAETAPIVLFMLIGGVVADRLPRRLTMLWSDSGRCAVALAVAWLGVARLLVFWHLLVLAFLFGLAEAFFRPAYQSIPPELVLTEDLSSANALTSLSRNLSVLLGPALGAVLVTASSASLAFAFDGLTFAVSALCLLAMGQVDRPAPLAPDADSLEIVGSVKRYGWLGSLFADIQEGIGYITGSTWLWLTIALASLGNVGLAPMQVALPKLVHDTYQQGVWLLGATLSASAAGSMVAALIMGQIRRPRKRGWTGYLALLVSAGAELCFGLPFAQRYAPAAPLVVAALAGAGLGVFELIWVTTLQELVPADKLGRVSSVDWMGSLLLQPVGLAVVGVMTDIIGPAWVFVAGGALNVALALVGLSSRAIRGLD